MALNDNLVAAWDFSTGSGSTIVDVVNSITLTLSGATFDSGGLLCDADGEVASVTAPTALKITGGALSFAWNGNILSAPPANYASWMGCSYNDAFGNPYWGYAHIKNDSGNHSIDFNNAGTYTAFATTTAPVTGAQNFLLVVANGLRTIYRNGTELTTGATSAVSAPTYDTTALFGVGDLVGGRNINTRFFQAYVWNADKSADASAFNSDPTGSGWAFAGGGGLSIPVAQQHFRTQR